MFSLPFIAPRPDASLWPTHRVSNTSFDNHTTDSPSSSHGPHHRPRSHHGNHHHHNSPSALATLAADENMIYQRKQNVRKFGAGWIRPPGVQKTYQAIIDEVAEKEEQDVLARREQALLDLAAAQTEAQNQQEATEGEDQDMGGERDLDEDVPEAEADESDLSADEPATSEVEEGDTTGVSRTADLTFNEDSFIEGSMVAAEVDRMLEMEEAEIAGVLQDGRDLDDDIPEAGSYEHTETETSDSSFDTTHSSNLSAIQNSGRRRRSDRRSDRRRSSGVRSNRSQRDSLVGSIDGSSSILGSSFVHSSPAAARGSVRARFMARGGRAG
ncbi:hypothetical protein BDV96DRAFT_610766 [Lophiotrema nucula]|uniref:Apc15p protein-domain-containing protein n=1 Tax=Lophiotrema nucula TaxID=690887 RepID=A0A6A5ZIL4_9PLEO|nr:hypothetical protein BDV96DRAFT_610766 [Lophiotrema nucula]